MQGSSARFNSRARVGRDPLQTVTHLVVVVSIHAPAWGATESAESAERFVMVSIHAPAWGATRKQTEISAVVKGFNSRARVGRDAAGGRVGQLHDVSIHAPAWGATRAATSTRCG